MGIFDDIPAGQGGVQSPPPTAAAPVTGVGLFDDLPKKDQPQESASPAKQPSFLDVAKDTVTGAPRQIYEAGKTALSNIWEGEQKRAKENEANPSNVLTDWMHTDFSGVPAAAIAPVTNLVKKGVEAVAEPIAGGMSYGAQAVGEPTARALNPNAKLPTHQEVYSALEPEVETALGLAIPKTAATRGLGTFEGPLRPQAMEQQPFYQAARGDTSPPPPPPPPEPPEDPFGVQLTKGEETENLKLRQRELAAKRNQASEQAYDVAKPWFDRRQEQLEAAKDVATARLSPTGDIVATTPHDAGTIISDTLKDQEAKRSVAAASEGDVLNQQIAENEEKLRPKGLLHPQDAADTVSQALSTSSEASSAAQQQKMAQLQRDREGIRGSLNNDGTVIAANPQEASDIISAGVTRAEEQATAARDAAYEKFESIPGSFRPQAFTNVANDVRRTLNDPKDPFILNDKTTPNTLSAIDDLDRSLGEPARVAADPDTQSFAPFTPSRINDVRKKLNAYWRAANNTARSTNDYSDLAGMNRVIDSFDGIVDNALKRKRLFDGNGRQISQAWDDANAAHANLRKTFSRQGSGDVVGPVMNKIVGAREGQAMPANQITQVTQGSGGTPVLVGRRLQDIFGPTSPEIGALKQGLWSKAVEPPEGVAPFTPEKVADNIHNLASSELGRTHFTPEELQRMRQHANDTRASVVAPKPATDVVGKAIDKINGVGGQPWTSEELRGHLFGRDGTGPTPLGEKLTQHVKDTYGDNSPEFQAIQRGQISSLTRVPQGRAGFDPQGIAGDVRSFLENKTAADRLYSPEQQDKLRQYADRLDNHATQSEAKLKDLEARTKIAPGDSVEKTIARITGRDGGPGASPMEVASTILGKADKTESLGVIRRLKQIMPPEKFAAIKQAIFRQTVEPGPTENKVNWGSNNIVTKIGNLFNKAPDLVNEVFSPEDQKMIKAFQEMHRKISTPQEGVNWSNNPTWSNRMMKRAIYGVGQIIGSIVGGAVGSAFGPWGAAAGALTGEAAGVGLGLRYAKKADVKMAKEISRLLPDIGQKAKDYQKALAAYQRSQQPYYKTKMITSGAAFNNALRPLGVSLGNIYGAAAAQDDKNKNTGPQNQKRNGGGVQPQTRAHGGTVGDSAPAKPSLHPVIHGARLAPDGRYYLPDASRPGKYLRVIERGRQHTAA